MRSLAALFTAVALLCLPVMADVIPDVQQNNVEIDGELDHDGLTLGFYGTIPIVRPASTTDIKDALTNLGLLQGTDPSDLNLDAGDITADEGFYGGLSSGDGVVNIEYATSVTPVAPDGFSYGTPWMWFEANDITGGSDAQSCSPPACTLVETGSSTNSSFTDGKATGTSYPVFRENAFNSVHDAIEQTPTPIDVALSGTSDYDSEYIISGEFTIAVVYDANGNPQDQIVVVGKGQGQANDSLVQFPGESTTGRCRFFDADGQFESMPSSSGRLNTAGGVQIAIMRRDSLDSIECYATDNGGAPVVYGTATEAGNFTPNALLQKETVVAAPSGFQLGELVIYKNWLTDAERDQLYQHLAQKYGVTEIPAGSGAAGSGGEFIIAGYSDGGTLTYSVGFDSDGHNMALHYDASNYCDYNVDSGGDLDIDCTGTTMTVNEELVSTTGVFDSTINDTSGAFVMDALGVSHTGNIFELRDEGNLEIYADEFGNLFLNRDIEVGDNLNALGESKIGSLAAADASLEVVDIAATSLAQLRLTDTEDTEYCEFDVVAGAMDIDCLGGSAGVTISEDLTVTGSATIGGDTFVPMDTTDCTWDSPNNEVSFLGYNSGTGYVECIRPQDDFPGGTTTTALATGGNLWFTNIDGTPDANAMESSKQLKWNGSGVQVFDTDEDTYATFGSCDAGTGDCLLLHDANVTSNPIGDLLIQSNSGDIEIRACYDSGNLSCSAGAGDIFLYAGHGTSSYDTVYVKGDLNVSGDVNWDTGGTLSGGSGDITVDDDLYVNQDITVTQSLSADSVSATNGVSSSTLEVSGLASCATTETDALGTFSCGSTQFLPRSIVNGTFAESFNALVTESAGVVSINLEQSGGGDLTMQFSDGDTTLDCTPAQTATLTAGSDTSPQENFVYVLQSTKALTVSTAGWPATEHIKVTYALVPSSTFVAASGAYINQNWNDHLTGADNMGHIAHIAERSRRDGAYYQSGIDGNGTDGYLTPTASNVELKATSGVIFQMHKHTVPAFDTSTGDEVLVVNWSGTPYNDITNLFDITADSTGTAINTNKYFNIVLWAVANKSGEYTPMMLNLPSCSYNLEADAQVDANGCDDYSIPDAYRRESSTGFLIARVTVQRKTTWVVSQTTDLRGLEPATATGGVSSAQTEFADNTFKVFDESDTTKELAFQVSGVTTGTTRTVTIPDASGTMAYVPGSDTQIVYNDTGSMGSEAAFTYDDATNTMSLDTINITGAPTGTFDITWNSGSSRWEALGTAAYPMVLGTNSAVFIEMNPSSNATIFSKKFNATLGGTFGGAVGHSTASSITAAGTGSTCTSCFLLSDSVNVVNTVASGTCVFLPVSTGNTIYSDISILNSGANSLTVCPSATGTTQINNGGAATGVSLAVNTTLNCYDMVDTWGCQ